MANTPEEVKSMHDHGAHTNSFGYTLYGILRALGVDNCEWVIGTAKPAENVRARVYTAISSGDGIKTVYNRQSES